MKLLLPGVGLLIGFLFGHGSDMPIDLFILMGAIVLTYAGVGALEVRRQLPSVGNLRRPTPTSH